MSLVIDLPPELESELAAEASQLGLELSEYVLTLLNRWRTSKEEGSPELEQEKVIHVLAASDQIRLPQPYSGATPYIRQTPVVVPGKPVSEIVIEQRGDS